jgi:SAM-dependent methyltransferase
MDATETAEAEQAPQMDNRLIEQPCPICNSHSNSVLYEPWVNETDAAKLYGAASGIQGTQWLVECSDCRMIYESPRLPDEVILQGYMSSDDAGHDSQHEMRVNSFYRALKKLADNVPASGAKILDIGTAGGAFLEAAERYGYQSFGMEPSHFLVQKAKERGLKVEQGTIAKHTFREGEFDMICLWDVLEHVTDPRQSMLDIRRLLKPNGVLLINFPDIGTWQARLAGRRFWWILSVHLQHFTRASVSDICERTGFNAFYFKPYWQTLEFGYLEDMAAHLGIPLTRTIGNLTPKFIRRIPVPYYASQTTALARIAP